jgi:hypothetical protein
VEFQRIDWPEPDEPRQARRCMTRACASVPTVEGECWLCQRCAERYRRERETLREALAGLLEGICGDGEERLRLSMGEWDRRVKAARVALAKAEGKE